MQNIDDYFAEFTRLKHKYNKRDSLEWLFEYAWQSAEFDDIPQSIRPDYMIEVVYKKLDDLLIEVQKNYDFGDVPCEISFPKYSEIKDVILYERTAQAVRLAELPCYDV